MLGRDVNLTKGILKHQNWRHIERLQELLKRIDEFKKIVDSLGRLQESIANDEVLESFFESISRVVEEIQEKIVHYIPEEMSGIATQWQYCPYATTGSLIPRTSTIKNAMACTSL